MAQIIAVVNQKGGVGKTTTVLNLGVCLAERQQRVLLVDLDPQAHLSLSLGFDIYAPRQTIYQVLCQEGVALGAAVLPTGTPGLDLIASSLHLQAAEDRLARVARRELQLRERFAPLVASGRYDYVLLDCMPSLGLLTVNALAAAGWVLVPAQMAFYAVESLGHIMAAVEFIRTGLNPWLRVLGIVPTFYDARTRQGVAVLAGLRRRYGDLVLEAMVKRTVKLDEASERRQSILQLAPTSQAARAYRQLAQVVMERVSAGS